MVRLLGRRWDKRTGNKKTCGLEATKKGGHADRCTSKEAGREAGREAGNHASQQKHASISSTPLTYLNGDNPLYKGTLVVSHSELKIVLPVVVWVRHVH